MALGPTLYFLGGVTASGKSGLALGWAEENNAEILSCDSIAIYRGMDLGSAKPTCEERERVAHHGLDLTVVGDGYDVSRYLEYSRAVVEQVYSRGRSLLVVGGSGFYLQSFFEPVIDEVEVTDEIRTEVRELFDQEGITGLLAQLDSFNAGEPLELDRKNPQRLIRALERCLGSGLRLSELRSRFRALPTPFSGYGKKRIWLDRTDADLSSRIEERTKEMISRGLVKETEALVAEGLLENHSACSSVGYRECSAFLRGEISEADLAPSITRSTRQLVAKQRKWFRKAFPRESRLLLEEGYQLATTDLKWSSGA